MAYFKDKREEMYPHIQDWSDPQDQLRHDQHKAFSDLIWFSPFMYRFMKSGLYLYFTGVFIFLIYLFKSNSVLVIILSLFGAYFAFKSGQEWKRNKQARTNLYDMFLRDWR